jgi:hypothetical protein
MTTATATPTTTPTAATAPRRSGSAAALLAFALVAATSFAGCDLLHLVGHGLDRQAAAPSAAASPSASGAASQGSGPLALIPAQQGTDLALAEGTLRLTDRCVLLVQPSARVLLVWPEDRTRWDPTTKTIAFTNFDGTTVVARDGDVISVGGSGDRNGDATAAAAWLARTTWVAPPDPSCPTDVYWFVGVLGR